MEIGSPSSGGDQEVVGVHVQEQEEKSGKGECASARARAHVVLFFLVVGAPSPCSSSTAGPKGGTPLGSAAAAAAVRGVGCRVAGLRAWPAGATRETPFPRSMPAAASPAPHPPPRKGGTSNRSRPGRGHARRPRRESRRRAAYLRQKGALCIPLPSALGARAPRGSRPPRRSCRRREFVAAVVVLWRARFELDLKVTSSSARMVASPPPPLLSAVPPQQQQQRYGLPPAPLSPLLPAPSTPTIMSTAGVPAPERPTPSRASEIRRATKPIMEKRRRARINQCLTELKALILDALNKDPSRHSKLEKADILEMTVRHLQNVQRHQVAAALSTDPVVMNKFRAGFAECATEVSRYVTRLEGVEPSLRQRLVGHLTSCVNGLNGGSVSGPNSPLGGVGPGLLISPLSVQIPTLADLHGHSGHLAGGTGGGGGRLQLGGLPLIPSRLPNGDLAFVLPAVATAPPATGNNNAAAPSNPAGPGPCWGPPTPTNTSTPTSPHPPRSPSPASSFGGSPLCSPGGSDIGSEDASSSDAMLMLQRSPSCFSPQPPSEELAALPRHRPPFFREVLHGLEATQRREPHEQREEDEDEDQSGGGDDSVWRPW